MSWFSDLFNPGLETTAQKTTVPEWMQPAAQNYLQSSQNLAAQPYNPYSGQTVAGLNPYQSDAYNAMAQRAMQGSPVNNAASGELQKTLSGGYMGAGNPFGGSNPYLQSQIDKAQGDVVRNFNKTAAPAWGTAGARSGSFGNSGLAEMENEDRRNLQGQLGNISSSMRFNDYGQQVGMYENERNRMQGAVSMAPTLANQDYADADRLAAAGFGFQQQEQKQLSDQYGRFQEARDYPQKQLDTLGKGLGMNFGSTSTMQTPGTSPAATGLGTAAGLYGLSKTNPSQPTVICTELHRQGLMSDEVFALDRAFGANMARAHPDVMAGYYRLAMPVVRIMRKSRLVTHAVNLLAAPWARHMAHLMGQGQPSIIGAAVMAVGVPLCRMAARKECRGAL